METISYKLPDFEGPLDLLLFLVQKNKLNIYDIPISQVLEQYLAAIQQMKDYNMDVASELLEILSPERLEKIENERSDPHPDEVLLMSRK